MLCIKKLNRTPAKPKCVLEFVVIVAMVTFLTLYFGEWDFYTQIINNNVNIGGGRYAQQPVDNVINNDKHSIPPKKYKSHRVSDRVQLNITNFKLTEYISNSISKGNSAVKEDSEKTSFKVGKEPKQNMTHNGGKEPKQNMTHNGEKEPKQKVTLTKGKEPKQKITHIGFLKVHKAGSTTMQNLFFRFGLRHNLTFVLPRRAHYVLSTQGILPVRNNSHRDILALHSIYTPRIFDGLLRPDSVKIGIIREPLDRMISAAYYYRDKLNKKYLRKVPTTNFIENIIYNQSIYDNVPFSRTRNSMGKDFGFSPSIKRHDTDLIENHMTKLKKDFSLVLVMERLDESLVLMKHQFNWELSDIIYLQSNSYEHVKESFNSSTIAKFKEINFLDQIIYDTFYKIFQSKIKDAGDGFKREVKQYRTILASVKKFCDSVESGITADGTRLRVAKSPWNSVFYVSDADCKLMVLHELKFVEKLRKRHISMHSNK